MPAHLAFHGVLVAGEGAGLHDNFVALRSGAVKRHHHQVQVDREGVHYYHFFGQGAYEAGGGFGEEAMVMHPGHVAPKVTFYTVFSPVVEFVQERRADAFGLQAQGVATEVQAILAVVLGKNKLVAVGVEWVLLVGKASGLQGILNVHGG